MTTVVLKYSKTTLDPFMMHSTVPVLDSYLEKNIH